MAQGRARLDQARPVTPRGRLRLSDVRRIPDAPTKQTFRDLPANIGPNALAELEQLRQMIVSGFRPPETRTERALSGVPGAVPVLRGVRAIGEMLRSADPAAIGERLTTVAQDPQGVFKQALIERPVSTALDLSGAASVAGAAAAPFRAGRAISRAAALSPTEAPTRLAGALTRGAGRGLQRVGRAAQEKAFNIPGGRRREQTLQALFEREIPVTQQALTSARGRLREAGARIGEVIEAGERAGGTATGTTIPSLRRFQQEARTTRAASPERAQTATRRMRQVLTDPTLTAPGTPGRPTTLEGLTVPGRPGPRVPRQLGPRTLQDQVVRLGQDINFDRSAFARQPHLEDANKALRQDFRAAVERALRRGDPALVPALREANRAFGQERDIVRALERRVPQARGRAPVGVGTATGAFLGTTRPAQALGAAAGFLANHPSTLSRAGLSLARGGRSLEQTGAAVTGAARPTSLGLMSVRQLAQQRRRQREQLREAERQRSTARP